MDEAESDSTKTGKYKNVCTTDPDVAYTPEIRLLSLHAGEILVETAADRMVPPRAFVVHTAHGHVRALGTRFTVRTDARGTRVAVLRDAVEIAAGPGTVVVREGQRVRFTVAALGTPDRLDEAETSWTGGALIVSDWRLGDLVAELARYRSGHLGCGAPVAGLRVSGAFPLHDTDRALAALEQSLPVRITRRTRFWVSVEAR